MSLQDVRPQSEPLHKSGGRCDGWDSSYIKLQFDWDGIPQQGESLLIGEVHAPSSTEVLPPIQVVAQVLDVVTAAECETFMLGVFPYFPVSAAEVLVIATPQLKPVPKFSRPLTPFIHSIIDILANECIKAFCHLRVDHPLGIRGCQARFINRVFTRGNQIK